MFLYIDLYRQLIKVYPDLIWKFIINNTYVHEMHEHAYSLVPGPPDTDLEDPLVDYSAGSRHLTTTPTESIHNTLMTSYLSDGSLPRQLFITSHLPLAPYPLSVGFMCGGSHPDHPVTVTSLQRQTPPLIEPWKIHISSPVDPWKMQGQASIQSASKGFCAQVVFYNIILLYRVKPCLYDPFPVYNQINIVLVSRAWNVMCTN